MNSSKHRHDGGAWRRRSTMISLYAKTGKDRTAARRPLKNSKKKGKCKR